MKSADFPEQNHVYESGATKQGLKYNRLAIAKVLDPHGFESMVSKWEPETEEYMNYIIQREMFLIVSGQIMPPVSMMGVNPFLNPSQQQRLNNFNAQFSSILHVINERLEQVSKHAYMPEDDFKHKNDELVKAALAYISQVLTVENNAGQIATPVACWPFWKDTKPEDMKPGEPSMKMIGFNPSPDPIKNIFKAIGFLMAEADRRINQSVNEGETTKD